MVTLGSDAPLRCVIGPGCDAALFARRALEGYESDATSVSPFALKSVFAMGMRRYSQRHCLCAGTMEVITEKEPCHLAVHVGR